MLLQTKTKNGTLQGIISSYLNALVRLLKLEGPDSFQTQVLRDSLLVALSVFTAIVSTKTLSENYYDSIWNLEILSKKRNMMASCTPCNNPWRSESSYLLTAAFAQYLLASDQICDPLICHESWDVFRDALTAIINHDVQEEEENLALLISPILCRALTKLAASSQVSTRQLFFGCKASFSDRSASGYRLLCSPWTMNLRRALGKLLDGSTGIPTLPYLTTLKGSLEYVGKELLNEVSGYT